MHAVLIATAMLAALTCSVAARSISPAAPTLRAAFHPGGHAQHGAVLSQAPPLQHTPCAWLRACAAFAAGGRSLTAASVGQQVPLLHHLRGAQAWEDASTLHPTATGQQNPRWGSVQLTHASSERQALGGAAVAPVAQSSVPAGRPDGRGPIDTERGRTARDVLTIVAGGKLADPDLVGRT